MARNVLGEVGHGGYWLPCSHIHYPSSQCIRHRVLVREAGAGGVQGELVLCCSAPMGFSVHSLTSHLGRQAFIPAFNTFP